MVAPQAEERGRRQQSIPQVLFIKHSLRLLTPCYRRPRSPPPTITSSTTLHSPSAGGTHLVVPEITLYVPTKEEKAQLLQDLGAARKSPINSELLLLHLLLFRSPIKKKKISWSADQVLYLSQHPDQSSNPPLPAFLLRKLP